VFTIKHRTYRVCFDCGREFDLDVHAANTASVVDNARLGVDPSHAR